MRQLTSPQCDALLCIHQYASGVRRQCLLKERNVSIRTLNLLLRIGYVMEIASDDVKNPVVALTPEGIEAMRIRRLPV